MMTNVSKCFVRFCNNQANHEIIVQNFKLYVCDECLIKVWNIVVEYSGKEQKLRIQYMKRIQDMEV